MTSINEDDLKKVVEYTELTLYRGYDLEGDLHNNFRPEEAYENGKESIWAIQYSKNDGTNYGNLNFSNRLIPPELEGILGGCDFYKPSHNLVNAYKTDFEGHPMFDEANATDYAVLVGKTVGNSQTVDPRLFITVGMPGTQFMFNPSPKLTIGEGKPWSRSNGNYGNFISLKQCVDPDLTDKYYLQCRQPVGVVNEPHRVPLCRRTADACRGTGTTEPDWRGYSAGEQAAQSRQEHAVKQCCGKLSQYAERTLAM